MPWSCKLAFMRASGFRAVADFVAFVEDDLPRPGASSRQIDVNVAKFLPWDRKPAPTIARAFPIQHFDRLGSHENGAAGPS
jgi:hypothetical protein